MRVLHFYQTVYRPANFPGDDHRTTDDTYEREVRKFDQYLLETQGRFALVEDLADEQISAAMAWLIGRKRSRTTANKLRRHLNALWAFAHRRKLTATTPDNDALRTDKKDPVAFLPDEKAAIIAAADLMPGFVGPIRAGLWWSCFVLTMFSYGPRIDVALATPTANLDLGRGEVLLPASRNKQRREQRRDLYDSAVERWRRIDPHGRGLVSMFDDWTYNERTLTRYWRKLLVLAGLAKQPKDVPKAWCPHCIRRTVASELYAVSGIHIACEVLDHSDVSVTWGYIDPRYTSQIRVRDLLDDPIGPAPDPRPLMKLWRPAAS